MKDCILILALASAVAAEPPRATVREARTVKVTAKSTVSIDAGVLQSTLLVLPEDEKIAAVFEGDKENWRYDTTKISGRFLSVKPTAPGVRTDLHIISDHGNSYSFLLQEVSQTGAQIDSKVFLEPADQAMRESIAALPKFVPAEELEQYKRIAEQAKNAANASQTKWDAAVQDAQKESETFRAKYPGQLKFNYAWDKKIGQQFKVSQIFNDGRFTYIKAAPQEAPTLYEEKDGKPSLVNFAFVNGLYSVPKVLYKGYLSVGKAKMEFWEAPE